ncbi:MAG TPA: hypothetical protein DCX07_03615 [Phycisphaerales bacterium]|nr:hypothetical protein [Phycisphaerales bacterium]
MWIEGGKLRFRVGRGEKPTLGGHTGPVGDLNGDGDDADFVYAESDVEQAWNPAKWYFVAASWQEESAPVLYVREMSAEGPAASPAAVKGEPVAAGGNVLAAVPAGSTGPRYEPLVVGARWINAGVPQTQDGADARIAYARFDKGYVTIESMNKVFESLAASAAETQAAK